MKSTAVSDATSKPKNSPFDGLIHYISNIAYIHHLGEFECVRC